MKLCPKCNKQHDKLGTYCCRSCANSRDFSAESIVKKSISAKLYAGAHPREKESEEKKINRFKKMSATVLNIRQHKINSEDFNNLSQLLKRERILVEQGQICNVCGMAQFWNDRHLKFHLDHISGDRKDESRSNLQMICPNCHSQTDTYGGKNGVKITNKQIEDALERHSNNNQLCIAIGLNPSAHAYERINKIRNNKLF